MRSILSKLTILYISAFLVFGVGLGILFRFEAFNQREQDRYFAAKAKKGLIQLYRQEYLARMGALTDSAIWDSAYEVANHPKPGWLDENYTDAGKNYGIEGMAVYDRAGNCVDKRVFGNSHDNYISPVLSRWFKGNTRPIQTTFFLRDRTHIDQFYISTIHPSGDSLMQKPYSGYLVMTKEWTEQKKVVLERISGVKLNVAIDDDKSKRIQDATHFSVPLLGPKGEIVANLIGEVDIKNLESTGESNLLTTRLFALFAIVLLLALVQGIYSWVVKPFTWISKALACNDPEPLDQLGRSSSEFGIIAAHLKETIRQRNGFEDKAYELENMVLNQKSEIEQRKYRDPLTGLPNRRFLRECIADISQLTGEYISYSLIFLDIDDLQLINDGLHESAGDDLLIKVAAKLRETVPLECVVVRYGGDEFGLLLMTTGIQDSVERVLFEVKSAFRQPIDCHGVSFQCSFCIGIATLTPETAMLSKGLDLIRFADIALYQAKAAGKDKVVYYDDQLAKSLEKRVLTEAGLRDAIRNQELELHYQPIVTIQDGTLHAVEALIRWNHPERGLIMPGEFIAIAESSDIVVSMGYYKMKRACRQILKLWEDHPEVPKFVLSINLSGKQLDCEEIVDQVELVLELTNFPPEYLQLEVTETTMAQNMELAVKRLNQLRDLGIRIAIDDFGTGYSSMSSLTDLPADVLKVDMCFVQKLPHDLEAVSILRAVSSMAGSFDMETVAEGVETEEQLEFLAILGFDHIQGWIMSKALPIENLELLLAADPHHFAHKLDVVKKLSDPEAA